MKNYKKLYLMVLFLCFFSIETQAGRNKDKKKDSFISFEESSKKQNSNFSKKQQTQNKENLNDANLPSTRSLSQKRKRENTNNDSYKKIRINDNIASPLDQLSKQVYNLRDCINKVHLEPERWSEINEIYQSFTNLNYSSETWKKLSLVIEKVDPTFFYFPNQTTKEAIGGYLFYPSSFINKWIEHKPLHHLLERSDIIWSLAAAAKFNEPRSQYYLGKELSFIWENWVKNEEDRNAKPPYIKALLKKAFLVLPEGKKNADVCYIMGQTYSGPLHLFGSYWFPFDAQKALDWFEQGKDLKNRFQSLEIRTIYGIDPIPTIEDYKRLGREGHEISFIEASRMAKTPEEEISILKEGEEIGQGLVLLQEGYIYEDLTREQREKNSTIDLKNIETERSYYRRAAEKGLSQGFLDLGRSYVGELSFNESMRPFSLEKISSQDIYEAIRAFEKAGDLKDYKGLDYLARLYNELAQITEKKKRDFRQSKGISKKELEECDLQIKNYYDQSEHAAHRASTLGCLIYRRSDKEFLKEQEVDEFIKKFNVIGKLMKSIENFLNL